MRVIVNHHAKVGGLFHEHRTPGMVVKAIIFPPTRDQTTRRILAVNAPARAVNFLPFSRLVVGLSPGTFRIHAHLVVHLGVDLAWILKATHQIQPVPFSKVSVIPAIEVIALQRNQSQVRTNHAVDTLNDAHGSGSEWLPNNLKPSSLYTHLNSPSLPWRSQAQISLSLLPTNTFQTLLPSKNFSLATNKHLSLPPMAQPSANIPLPSSPSKKISSFLMK